MCDPQSGLSILIHYMALYQPKTRRQRIKEIHFLYVFFQKYNMIVVPLLFSLIDIMVGKW